MAELKPCPFCGAKSKIKIESRKREVWRNGFGDYAEYRTFHVRCTVCNARGGTVGGMCGNPERIVKMYGEVVELHSFKYYEAKAITAWNRRADNG